MRNTYGRTRPVCGSQVRSEAVETFVSCRMPSASDSSATACESSLELEPMIASAPARAASAAASRASTK
jgi:hypothetical protein